MNSLFPLAAAFIWGGNAIVTKASAGVITPAEIAFYRWVLALLLLTPFVARQVHANRRTIRAQLWRLAILGWLGGAAFSLLAYASAQFTSALDIGIIQSLMPLLAVGLSIALLGHQPTWGAIAGGMISLGGVVIVVSHGAPEMLVARGPNIGDAIMLAATACYAVYTVLLKRWGGGSPLLQSLYVQASAAALGLLPFYLLSARYGISAANLPLVAYAGALASVAAPLVWMHGIARIGPARMSLFFNLVPVVTAALAAPLLGEQLTLSLLLGGSLTIGGVVLAELWRSPVGRAFTCVRLHRTDSRPYL